MNRKDISLIAALLLIALFLRAPFVSAGMPFFYQEDEAHHFNRVVNMVKKGTYNPNYFHKPSLHFYLRMPVVAASFLWSVKKGHIRKLEEIRTEDPFGVGKYAFTASHEGIVKWNRALSLGFSLLLVLLTYELARLLLPGKSPWLHAAGTLPVVVSPDLLLYSGTVGVDVLMAMLCMASVVAALHTLRSYSLWKLLGCGLLCGLAISSKYNALPIALVPLGVAVAARRFEWKPLLVAAASPAAGFFIGSPYTLVSLPLFLDQFAYEIWHYGVVGHEGHMTEPGLPQLLFYLGWLGRSALGAAVLVLALVGVVVLAVRKELLSKLFLLFPVLFFWLMCLQKANFERNLLAVIPFLSVAALAGLLWLVEVTRLRRFAGTASICCIMLACIVQPAVEAIDVRADARGERDSRRELAAWLDTTMAQTPGKSIALAGQLQMPPRFYRLPQILVIDQEKLPDEAVKKPFDILITHGPLPAERIAGLPDFSLEREFKGNARPAGGVRVMKNPDIQVFVKR